LRYTLIITLYRQHSDWTSAGNHALLSDETCARKFIDS